VRGPAKEAAGQEQGKVQDRHDDSRQCDPSPTSADGLYPVFESEFSVEIGEHYCPQFLEYSTHPGAKTILYPKRFTGPALSRARERQY
jgi:hypothetical protein